MRLTSVLFFVLLLACRPGLADQIQKTADVDLLRKKLNAAHGRERTDILLELAWEYRNSSPEAALDYALQAQALATQQHYDKGHLKALSFAGVSYRNLGNYFQAVKSYTEALQLAEKLEDREQMCYSLINLGNVYLYEQRYDDALNALDRAVPIARQENDSRMTAYVLLNQGRAYTGLKRYTQALEVLNEAQLLREQLNDLPGKAVILNDIGNVYLALNDHLQAFTCFTEALHLSRTLTNDDDLISDLLNKLAKIHLQRGDHATAFDYASQALTMAKEINSLLRRKEACFVLSDCYTAFGEFDKSLAFYKEATRLQDSLSNVESSRKMAQIEVRYEYDKQMELQKVEQERATILHESQMKRQRLISLTAFIGLSLMFLLGVVIYRSYRIKQKDNLLLARQKARIEQQRDQVAAQKDQIEEQKRLIEDSIEYASRIQHALLPPSRVMQELLPEHFVLFRPRDVVSGDFYWVQQAGKYVVVAVADCTGHGVPGSLMSMLGMSFLKEIITTRTIDSAADILEALRRMVKDTLHQTGQRDEQKDGMDIALYLLDRDELTISFAGAFNPLYIVRKNGIQPNEILKIKADRQPIGIYLKEYPFGSEVVPVQKGDMLYSFSDGYADQFGGTNFAKFKYSNLQNLLQKISDKSMHEQKAILEFTLDRWKGDNPQIDDILLVGVRV